MGEDIGRQLYAHADIDPVGFGMDAQGITDALHPFAAASSGGDDAVSAGVFFVLRGDERISLRALAHFIDTGAEMEVHFLAELCIQVLKHHIVDVRAQMTNRCLQQVQIVFQAFPAYGCVVVREQAGVLSAVAAVDAVHIFHQGDGFFLADIFIEVAAEFVGDVVLAI